MGVPGWSRDGAGNSVADPRIAAMDGASARSYAGWVREVMAAARRQADDQGGALVTTGSLNAYVVTTGSGLTELRPGLALLVKVDRTNTATATLNVDGLGPLPWVDAGGVPLQEGRLILGRFYATILDTLADGSATAWRVQAGASTLDEIPGLAELRDEAFAAAEDIQEAVDTIGASTQTATNAASQATAAQAQTAADRTAVAADRATVASERAAAQSAAASAAASAATVNGVLAGDAYNASSVADLANAPADATRAYVNADPNPANVGLWTRPLGGAFAKSADDTLQTVAARIGAVEAANENRFVGPYTLIPGFGPGDDVQYDGATSRVLRAVIGGIVFFATAAGLQAARDDATFSAEVTTIVDDRITTSDGPYKLDSLDVPWCNPKIDSATGRVVGGLQSDGNTYGLIGGALAALGGATSISSGIIRPWTWNSATGYGYYAATQNVLLILPVLGQSNADARNDDTSDPLISTAPVYPGYALMPNVGPRIPDGATVTALVDLVENTPFATRRETLCSGLANHLIAKIEAGTGIRPKVCTFVCALNGQSVTNLNSGSPTHEKFRLALAQIVQVARTMGLTPIVPGVVWVQGEANKEDPVFKYKTALRQYVRALSADIRLATGQTDEPLFFMSQVAATASSLELSGSAVAQGELHGEGPFRCIGPMYPYPITSTAVEANPLHLKCLGQYRQGQAAARSIFAEICGEGAECLRILPDKSRWRSTTVLDLACSVPGLRYQQRRDPDTNELLFYQNGQPILDPVGGLRILTGNDVVDPIFNAHGITFRTPAGANLTLSDMTTETADPLMAKTLIRCTFSSPVTTPVDMYAALQGNGTSGNGPEVGSRATIANTLNDASLYDGHLMNDWLCAGRFQFSRP